MMVKWCEGTFDACLCFFFLSLLRNVSRFYSYIAFWFLVFRCIKNMTLFRISLLEIVIFKIVDFDLYLTLNSCLVGL